MFQLWNRFAGESKPEEIPLSSRKFNAIVTKLDSKNAHSSVLLTIREPGFIDLYKSVEVFSFTFSLFNFDIFEEY